MNSFFIYMKCQNKKIEEILFKQKVIYKHNEHLFFLFFYNYEIMTHRIVDT